MQTANKNNEPSVSSESFTVNGSSFTEKVTFSPVKSPIPDYLTVLLSVLYAIRRELNLGHTVFPVLNMISEIISALRRFSSA